MDRGSSFVGNPSPPSPHRISDVLQALRTQIVEGDIDLAANLAMSVVGDADAARLSNSFEPRGDIDTVAKDIASPDHHVPDVHPDAKVDLTIRRQLMVCVRPCGLRLDGALHGIYRTCKFRQQVMSALARTADVVRRDDKLEKCRIFPILG